MNPGSVFLDKNFKFHDNQTGRKLFLSLGSINSVFVVVKTTSKQHDRGRVFGCQPSDRFHNFYLPPGSCDIEGETWICLDEFYEFKSTDVLVKKFNNIISSICDIKIDIVRQIQQCALESQDISEFQAEAIAGCLL